MDISRIIFSKIGIHSRYGAEHRRDLSIDDLDTAAEWPLARQPYLPETNLPGVFAVGYVREIVASNVFLRQLEKSQLQSHLITKCCNNKTKNN
ncbi:MAG: hypothetical protein ACTHJ2_08425 [Candidatus Nitrosocosmicus sp.]